jgi:hypothetical protein
MSAEGGSYWTIAELLARVRNHDWSISDFQVLGIVHALAGAGRVHAIGRRCNRAGEARDEWEPIPGHQWADLVIPLPPRARPHEGTVFWSSSNRLAWASVKFCEPELLREWLAAVFDKPRRAWPADIIVPVPPKAAPESKRRPTQAEVNQWMLDRATREVNEKNALIKRDPTIQECMQAKGVQWRVALSAFGELPRNLRRHRGQVKRANK